jgi:hypothetical protein
MVSPMVTIWVVGSLSFCCEAEVYAALELRDRSVVTRLAVPSTFARLIPCYCCGFACDGLASPLSAAR